MIPNILTRSNNFVDFLNPIPESIWIEDIAEGLSKCCRYSGQCYGFLSVAEHSVAVSHTVPEGVALQALLHDGSEAYTGDIISPLKMLLPDFQAIEKRLQAVIYKRFGVPEIEADEVKVADYRMFLAEAHQVIPPNARWDINRAVAPAQWNVKCLIWQDAKDAFLNRFHQLYNGTEGVLRK